MKICVLGLWHLGSVTAACLASVGHKVIGLDLDKNVVDMLKKGVAPIFEPGLNDKLQEGISSENLSFEHSPSYALANVNILWVAIDTPVKEDDQADVDNVLEQIKFVSSFLNDDTLIIVSSQLPVGTLGKLEKFFLEKFKNKKITLVCIPENLRLGKSLSIFLNPDRVIVGLRDPKSKKIIKSIFSPFTSRIEWVSIESAEMIKHSINSFLAISISFANEIASICEMVGADAKEVERGLKSECRIGPRAYLAPGGPFAGGTLARDISFLCSKSLTHKLNTPLISSVLSSNNHHKNWYKRKLKAHLNKLKGSTVGIWGLSYKSDTNTLRRSLAIDLIEWMLFQGIKVRVYDPEVAQLPNNLLGKVTKCTNPQEVLSHAEALVLTTEWPEFQIAASQINDNVNPGLIILDPNRFVEDHVTSKEVKYLSVGMPDRKIGDL